MMLKSIHNVMPHRRNRHKKGGSSFGYESECCQSAVTLVDTDDYGLDTTRFFYCNACGRDCNIVRHLPKSWYRKTPLDKNVRIV